MNKDFIEQYITTDRLNSYTNKTAYVDNIKLCSDVYPLLNIFEVSFRNKILYVNNRDYHFPLSISRIDKNGKKKDNYFSYWSKCMDDKSDTYIEPSKIFNKMNSIGKKRLKYSEFNQIKSGANVYLYLAVNNVRTIRNRTFHCENLFKLNKNARPRISHAKKLSNGKRIIMSINPDKIKFFLEDMINALDENILRELK